MIKQGMNLTKEQRGEIKQEAKMDASTSASAAISDDKKSTIENDEKKNIQVCRMMHLPFSCF